MNTTQFDPLDPFNSAAFVRWYESSDWANHPVYRDVLWAGWVAHARLANSKPSAPRDEAVLAKRQLDAMLVQMLTSDGPGQLDYILANAEDLAHLANHIKRLEWEHE